MIDRLEKKLGRKALVLLVIAVVGLIAYANSFTAPFVLDDYGSIVNNKSIRDLSDIKAMWDFYSSRFIVYITFSINWTIHNKLTVTALAARILCGIVSGIAAFLVLYTVLSLRKIRKALKLWQRLFISLAAAVITGFLPIYPDDFTAKLAGQITNMLRDGELVGFHATNLIIHVFNAWLVYLIIRNILSLEHFSGKLPGRYKHLVSTVSALVFVCHPMQVNAVTYIVQRIASLASMFYLLSVLFFILYRIRNRIAYFLLTLVFTVLAMYSKENTITIPFMLTTIEFLFFLKDGKTRWWKRALFLAVLLSTVVIIPGTELFLGGYSQSDPGGQFKASTDMSRLVYFYTQMNVIMLYIRLLFIPDRQCFDYSNDFPKSYSILDNYSWVCFIVLLAIGLIALYNRKKNKLFCFGVLWFFIALSVESSFISIKDVYFEHRLYLPMAGFIMAIAGLIFAQWNLEGEARNVFAKPITLFIAVSIVMIPYYTVMTLKRNYVYSDEVRLWSDVVEKAPYSDRGYSSLAAAYMDLYEIGGCEDEELFKKAEESFKLAIKVAPYNETAHSNYAKLLYLGGRYEECIKEANIAISIDPSKYSYYHLGNGYRALGNYEKALEAYRKGYNLDKECSFIILALADLYYETDQYYQAYTFYSMYDRLFDSKYARNRMKKLKEEYPFL